MFSFARILTIATFALVASAAPSPAPEVNERAAAVSCSNAYNGNNPNHLGPGVTYGCSKVSWVSIIVEVYTRCPRRADHLPPFRSFPLTCATLVVAPSTAALETLPLPP
jgi:hypothetical protein